jgi:hypothetical protein
MECVSPVGSLASTVGGATGGTTALGDTDAGGLLALMTCQVPVEAGTVAAESGAPANEAGTQPADAAPTTEASTPTVDAGVDADAATLPSDGEARD